MRREGPVQNRRSEKDLEAPEAERQADTHDGRTETHSADEQTEKRSSSPAPPTTEPASAPAEPAPSAPEENRVGENRSEARVSDGAENSEGAEAARPETLADPHPRTGAGLDQVHAHSERDLLIAREGEQGEPEGRRIIRYPDAHQLFVGNVPHDVDKNELKEFFEQYGTVLELRINSGGKLPNFGFVVFDDSEPVQKILNNKPIKFRGDIRLNVEEKKTRSAREGDRRDSRPRGPGGPRERIGGGPRGPPTRGGMSQKPSFGSGRGAGPSEGRFSAPRQ
ncbi:Ras GTPase-activating protein-binding protein 1 [Oryzias melastigma]|uniref:Ras GTPase-activating protein-binding protein 1 n=1 Tax=Oryzias melastigma TaxID=30732 RepID=A0A834CK08_ORYME|nr:Ras GTPase-activating protein-binding protein 1 [Oryzias melastigma]